MISLDRKGLIPSGSVGEGVDEGTPLVSVGETIALEVGDGTGDAEEKRKVFTA